MSGTVGEAEIACYEYHFYPKACQQPRLSHSQSPMLIPQRQSRVAQNTPQDYRGLPRTAMPTSSTTTSFSIPSARWDTRPSTVNGHAFFDDLLVFPEDGGTCGASQGRAHPAHIAPNSPFRIYEPDHSGVVGYKTGNPTNADGSSMVLTHPVDSSMYEEVRDEDWVLSSVDYETLASPSSSGAHSAGPDTPRSPFFGNEIAQSTSERYSAADWPSKKAAKVDLEKEYPTWPLSLPSSFSSSFTLGEPHMAFSAPSSFGSLTYAGFPELQSVSTAGDASSISYHGNPACHVHGLPMGNSFYSQSIHSHHTARPTMSPPVFQPVDGLQDLDQDDPDSASERTDLDGSECDLGDQSVHDALLRRDRDRYLVSMRRQGVSYKEIKRRGGFREAESTLRGRVRVLTKDKSARVRHPTWLESDENLLEQAIERYAEFDLPGRGGGRDVHGRVPWKKISDWMHVHGSSYHFAPATCAKKWRKMD